MCRSRFHVACQRSEIKQNLSFSSSTLSSVCFMLVFIFACKYIYCTNYIHPGYAHRQCLQNSEWESPNVLDCSTPEISILEERVKSLNTKDNVTEIADDLSYILKTSQQIFPRDISSITNISDIILDTVQLNIEEVDQLFIQNVTEDIVEVLDIVFDDENDRSFQYMLNESRSQATKTESERLLATSEQTGRLLSNILDVDTNETVNTTLIGSRNNIAIAVVIPTEESLTMKGNITLPKTISSVFGHMTPTFQIPSTVILNQINEEGRRVPIISTIIRNSHLPRNESNRVVSLILSIQISSDEQSNISLGNETVSMTFSIENTRNNTQKNTYCAFFNLSSTNQSGSFSTDGISTDRIIQNDTTNNTFVQCSTTHLTSFAVLVDVSGGRATTGSVESKALTVISYIGCAVSIVCLLIAVMLFISLRKKVFNLKQHFVHTNLSIALLLGLITFVSGVEAASDHRGTCLTVTILLHYFFMAAFSWMLCEGILMFIMIKLVFYDGFLKRKLFFFMLGWGLPIPIVVVSAALSHEHYGINDRCWISEENGAIWAFIGPMLLIIAVNLFILVIAIYEVFKSKYSNMTTEKATALETVKSLLKAAVIFVPLLGTTWVFGILAVNENTTVFAWIFTVLNSLQGLLILILYVLRNEKFLNMVRNKWNSISGTESSYMHQSSKSHSLPKKAKHFETSTHDDTQCAGKSVTINSAVLRSYDNVVRNDYTLSEGCVTSTQVESSNVLSVGNPHSIDDVYETKVTPERNEESMSTFQNVKHHEEEITEESHL